MTKSFRELLEGLPVEVQNKAREAFRLWRADPSHPSLKFKRLSPYEIYSVRIGLHYRALCVEVEPDVYVWHWIGSHSDYDREVRNL